jgi:hypothetical protein
LKGKNDARRLKKLARGAPTPGAPPRPYAENPAKSPLRRLARDMKRLTMARVDSASEFTDSRGPRDAGDSSRIQPSGTLERAKVR